MKYLSVSACFIVLSSCAAKNNTASFLQHESKSTDIKAEYTETENNIEKYKYQLEDKLFLITKNIMEDEKEITKALSYKRMVRFIGYIKKELDKSLEIIDEYQKKSDNAEYQSHIEYVKCTYLVLICSHFSISFRNMAAVLFLSFSLNLSRYFIYWFSCSLLMTDSI